MIKQIAAISSDVKRWSKANANEKRPAFKKLIQVLIAIDSESAVVVPKVDPQIEIIVARGKYLSTKGRKTVKMASNQCHYNTATLYVKGKIDAICTGYALAQDGGWRSHSWGIKDNKVVETTQGGYIKYFGVFLNKTESKHFLEDNYEAD